MRRAGRALAAAFLLGFAACSCRAAPVAPPDPSGRESAVSRAIRFLAATQLDEGDEALDPAMWAGGWAMEFRARRGALGFGAPDVASAPVAYVHHALLAVERAPEGAAGVTVADRALARDVRRRAARFLERFATRDDATGATAYGWWPPARPVADSPLRRLVSHAFERTVGGPFFRGTRAPWTLPPFPPAHRVWPDLDSTALVLSALVADARADGEPPPAAGLDRLAAACRDRGEHALRYPSWLAAGSGAYLTWIVPEGRRGDLNDVDAVVNANVLRALAQVGAPDAPGAREAEALVLHVVSEGRHARLAEVSDYYAQAGAVAYLAALAWREGPVPALAPAVAALSDSLERTAVRPGDGTAHWGDAGEAPGETALATAALALAGRRGPCVTEGAEFLRRAQDSDGGWPSSLVCTGRSSNGWLFVWRARWMATAIAIEALLAAS